MRDPTKKLVHLRIDPITREPLRFLADFHHRSQANTVEWLILEEYRRVTRTDARQQETTP